MEAIFEATIQVFARPWKRAFVEIWREQGLLANLTCTLIWRTVYAVMAYKALTVEDLLALMKKIQGEKTNTEFAADLGISKQYLSDLYSGRKIPSDTVSAVFGFEQKVETRYVPSTTAAKPEAPSVREPSRKKTRRARKRDS